MPDISVTAKHLLLTAEYVLKIYCDVSPSYGILMCYLLEILFNLNDYTTNLLYND